MDKQVQILKQKNKEANQFIIEIAKMLNIETDGVGYDDIQLSLDDFENAIRALDKPSSVPQVNKSLGGSLLDLDGKTIPVTFHVSKYKPKINIDLRNEC